MKSREEIAKIQKHLNSNLRNDTLKFTDALDKRHVSAVLLSGSVARGDFYPGRFGGMIDLTVMRNPKSTINASEIFGPNQNPTIPYHCIKIDKDWFQIAFHELITAQKFPDLDEAKKFALLESDCIWETEKQFTSELVAIEKYAKTDQKNNFEKCLGYIGYLLSEYKEDRWLRREAFVQLHANLNIAVQQAVKCLFYLNGFYAPAEDRREYYAFSLPKLPKNFGEVLEETMSQDIYSEGSYSHRRAIFMMKIMEFIEENRI